MYAGDATRQLLRDVRVSRRRLVRGAAGGLSLVAGAGLACGGRNTTGSGAQQPAAAGAAKKPQRGGVLNHATGTAGGFDTLGLGFDPHTQGQSTDQSFTLFYERLL